MRQYLAFAVGVLLLGTAPRAEAQTVTVNFEGDAIGNKSTSGFNSVSTSAVTFRTQGSVLNIDNYGTAGSGARTLAFSRRLIVDFAFQVTSFSFKVGHDGASFANQQATVNAYDTEGPNPGTPFGQHNITLNQNLLMDQTLGLNLAPGGTIHITRLELLFQGNSFTDAVFQTMDDFTFTHNGVRVGGDAVPEPVSAALFAPGLLAAGAWRTLRRRRREERESRQDSLAALG